MSLSLLRLVRSYLTDSSSCMLRRSRRPLFGAAAARRWTRLGAIAILVLGPTSLVSADPITFSFRVDRLHECIGVPCTFVPIPGSFSLSLSFESLALASIDELNLVRRDYGPPIFSNVPLARPAISPGAVESGQVVDQLARLRPGVVWSRFAQVGRGQELITPTASLRWFTTLSAFQMFDPEDPLPALTPASLAEFLGRGGSFGFSYEKNEPQPDGSGRFTDTVAYFGTLTLQPQSEVSSPTPEPTTSLLIITGFGLCATWRRKRLV